MKIKVTKRPYRQVIDEYNAKKHTHIKPKKPSIFFRTLMKLVSLPDMIAIFLGVLELIKIRKILIHDTDGTLLDMSAQFTINDNPDDVEKDANGKQLYSDGDEEIKMEFDKDSKGGSEE